MKKLTLLAITALLAFGLNSCNLSKTVTLKDTVKAVMTSTPDFFQFYDEVLGEGKVKDYNHTIILNEVAPDFEYKFIPSPFKGDDGYYILKPAQSEIGRDTSLEPAESLVISVPRKLLKPITVPQRGN